MGLGVRRLAAIIGLAGIYFATGKLGLSLAFLNVSASAVWPPTGIALACLLLWGRWLWPGIFIGAFLTNITTQGSLLTALGIGTGNTLEALAGALLVQHFAGGVKAFERLRDILRFIFLAALLSTALSATLGVSSLCLGGLAKWEHYGAIWLTWWVGDLVSNLVVAPLIVLWATQWRLRLGPKQLLEAAALLVSGITTGLFVFGNNPYAFAYLTLLPCLWAVFRFGQIGGVTSVFVITHLSLWGTLRGHTQFTTDDPNQSLQLLQVFIGTISIATLLTGAVTAERKRAEQRLVEANAELEEHARKLEEIVAERTAKLRESVGELETFSYSIAHDMRAPLRAMHSFAVILQEEEAKHLSPPGCDYLRRISTSAKRLDALIQDVLNYSQVVRAELKLEPVDMGKLISEIVESYPNLHPPQAEIHAKGHIPEVLANTAALTQVISNLLANAVKFVKEGVRPKVEISAETQGEHVRVWFRDNGIGIAPEVQHKLFQMFQRLHAPRDYEGTGMGLTIVRKAVERMGGKVGVESAPGHGSQFWVELRKASAAAVS